MAMIELAAPATTVSTPVFQPEQFTSNAVSHTISVAVIVVIAIVLQSIASIVIKRIARHQLNRDPKKLSPHTASEAPLPKEVAADRMRRESRINTLSAVARSTLAILIWGWAFIGVLSEFGIEVRPILASAGVLGLAIGFGAKSLVQDFITGIFMLIEDQYGVGDWIQVGDISGTVENVSLRITTLRDVDGNLWYVRNGQITTVGNSTKGFATARLDVPISLNNDVDAAEEVILATVKQVAASDLLSEYVLDEEPTMDGVADMKPDHMTIRVRLKVIPGQQWYIQRQLLTRIIPALAKAGIKTPYPNGIGINPGTGS
ncbi:mechanosensitive ion channel family protein [Corynebacterium sp. CCM 8862]|uniref:Mechanosensitive ion channel family protein n=3 Tax=Corynebacterium mendelii TaxID=2765362 RepID=A0A939IXK4_9CORY|nr:mechanosensitive ion channel family protein [Corynebacterium mendelii]